MGNANARVRARLERLERTVGGHPAADALAAVLGDGEARARVASWPASCGCRTCAEMRRPKSEAEREAARRELADLLDLDPGELQTRELEP